MKVVLFHFGEFVNSNGPMAKRLQYYAKCLNHGGIDVHVIALAGKLETEYSGFKEDIKYTLLRRHVVPSLIVFSWLNNFARMSIYVHFVLKKTKVGDVCVLSGFGWLAQVIFIATLKLTGRKVVLEVNENPYSPEGGRLDPLWLRKIHNWCSLNAPFRMASGFIVISNALHELVKKYKSSKSKIIKIPILVDACINIKESEKSSNDFHEPYILHAGGMSETKDGVIAMVTAFCIAAERVDIPLHFIRTSHNINRQLDNKVFDIFKSHGLIERYHVIEKLSENELQKMLVNSRLAIINKPINWQNNYNFPTKLGELLALGVPTLVSKGGEMEKFLIDKINTMFFNPDDVSNIANKMVEILTNSELRDRISEGGKVAAKESFHYLIYSKELCTFARNLSGIEN